MADVQGTVHDIVNASGAVINHVEHDSFGNVLAETEPLAGDRFWERGLCCCIITVSPRENSKCNSASLTRVPRDHASVGKRA